MGYEMFDMWNAMKRASYSRIIDELEDSLSNMDGDGDEMIKLCLDRVSNVLHTQASSFWVYHLGGDGLIRPHAYNGSSDIGSIRMFPGEGIVGKVIESGKSLIIEDCHNDPNFASRVDSNSGFVTKTMICVPTIANSMAFGCIQLINKEDDSFFDKQDLELAEKLAKIISDSLLKRNVLEKYGFGSNDEMAASTKKGKYEEAAIVFVDMVGFTELAYSVDTYILMNIVNNYMNYVSKIIAKYNGYFDKILCDRIQAFWRTENVDNKETVYRACKAALEIISCIDELKSVVKNKYGVDMALKVGVTYGEVYVGNVGLNQSLDYTVIGKEVSLAKMVAVACESDTVHITREVLYKLNLDEDRDIKKADKLRVGKNYIEVFRLINLK